MKYSTPLGFESALAREQCDKQISCRLPNLKSVGCEASPGVDGFRVGPSLGTFLSHHPGHKRIKVAAGKQVSRQASGLRRLDVA